MTQPLDTKAIEKACAILRAGGLVAIPTETVYGLAADADNEKAVLATFAVKGRPTNHPLIVHVANADAIPFWASVIPEAVKKLTDAFWPGPLTIVLKKAARCGDFVTGGQDSVALRCPSHPTIHELLRRFEGETKKGLTAPSCNTFGKISPTSAAHVEADLGVKPTGKLDMILDGGICDFGVESTMINLSGARPEILRHGAITREMLEDVLGCKVPDAGADAPRASGRLKSHYAPTTKLELVPKEKILSRLEELQGTPVALMASKEILSLLKKKSFTLMLESPATQKDYAHVLYDNLHQMDNSGAARLLIECPPTTPEWAAVNDRLGRAAADKGPSQ